MIQFLNEGFNTISGMIVLSILLGLAQYFAAKVHVDSQDKKRVSKGMAVMTNEEREIAVEAFRSAIIVVGLTILGTYTIFLIVSYIALR